MIISLFDILHLLIPSKTGLKMLNQIALHEPIIMVMPYPPINL